MGFPDNVGERRAQAGFWPWQGHSCKDVLSNGHRVIDRKDVSHHYLFPFDLFCFRTSFSKVRTLEQQFYNGLFEKWVTLLDTFGKACIPHAPLEHSQFTIKALRSPALKNCMDQVVST